MNQSYKRAEILYQQKRFADAEREFRQSLSEHPGRPQAHAMIGICCVEQSNYRGARESAETAISLAPDYGFPYYVLTWTLLRDTRLRCARKSDGLPLNGDSRSRRLHMLKLARSCILTAIERDPENASYHALLAHVLLEEGKTADALREAQAGLAIDPRDAECLKVQAMLLQSTHAIQVAAGASAELIAADPTGAVEHAIHGRTLLIAGRRKEAMEHLNEAMRLNPQQPYVRRQFLEGLRGRHLIYGLFLRSAKRSRWGFHFEGVILFLLFIVTVFAFPLIAAAILASIANPHLWSLLFGLAFLPAAWFLFTKQWINFLLQFDSRANPMLTSHERWVGNVVVCSIFSLLFLHVFASLSSWLKFEFSDGMFWLIEAPLIAVFVWIHKRYCRPIG